jgi:signal transduction histidine kinase
MSKSSFTSERRNLNRWTFFLVLLLLGGINLLGWFYYEQTRAILEDEFSQELQLLTTTAVELLDNQEVARLAADPDNAENKHSMDSQLTQIRNIIHARDIYLLGENGVLLSQSQTLNIESSDPLLMVDQGEINQAFKGTAVTGMLYKKQRIFYKRGYAPIFSATNKVDAVLAVEFSTSFVRITDRIWKALMELAGVSLFLIILAVLILQRIYSIFFNWEEKLLIADKYQSLAQLTAGFAHEIRNPLGIISGNAELLRDSLAGDSRKQAKLDSILEETERMSTILKNFMDYARPSSLQFTRFDLCHMIRKSLELCEYQLRKANIEMVLILPENELQILGDDHRLRQVFLNLILNSRDAMPHGGTITISAVADGKKVIVQYQDSGTGMTPDQLNKAFNPFYSTKTNGSGLGLTITRRIIEAHQGKIEIQSELGKGTVILITFPAKQES